MPLSSPETKTLKYILENSLHPEQLDSHPWTDSLFARESPASGPDGQSTGSGQQLVTAIAKLFSESMPGTPPRQGKRLDTHWGKFGLLAARYFAPLLFGAPAPASLRDAWSHIDQSILLFVYGKPEEALSKSDQDTYRLVGNEPEVAPHSTLSDWHRKGLQRLLDAILAREAYLAQNQSVPAIIPAGEEEIVLPEQKPDRQKIKKRPSGRRRVLFLVSTLFLLGLLAVAGHKAWQVYKLALVVQADMTQLQDTLVASDDVLERARAAGPELGTLRKDLSNLREETQSWFWLGPRLTWVVPEYGAELASIRELVDLAETFLAASDMTFQSFSPLLEDDSLADIDPARLTQFLKEAQPQLAEAQLALDEAIAARERIDPGQLSPRVRNLIVNNIDPLLPIMQDGLTLAMQVPHAMGATSEGPKTYLLLALNEDELRPNGGFITAAGTMLVQDGKIRNLSFQNSGNLEDWSKPYPAAPWQLSQYMNSPVLVLRDTSWFTNYPTSAQYAENLYSYISNHSVDGVIAFNQQFLVKLLRATGPIKLEGVSKPIDADNVIAYMRAAKEPTPEEYASLNWDNKAFINQIAGPLIEKILSGEVDQKKLTASLLEALNERDLLLQLDNPALSSLIARYEWDGAVRPGNGDFLMVADSNIGFNKTNAVVESSLVYEVDLTRPSMPTASLTVTHKNNAAEMFTCKHWNKIRAEGEKYYPITDCYWNYMRIYRAEGTILFEATPQFVPANWMINFQSVPPKVDNLEEEIEHVTSFGTLQVIPGGHSLETNFLFSLPLNTVEYQTGSNQAVYRLKVEKQPGTLAVPLTIRVHFGPDTVISRVPEGATIEGDTVSYPANLRTDLEFEIAFSIP